ncbi:hypothetical protein BDV95DRAFT_491534 [Massariosphaeria phaeospora]|uniref:C2H2 type master regulator of conidiophore development brlA n=1 Tax=Massariosphaeria phaeospora TaxID=100035 RepID=A0A7C8MDK8_9PLEO|nr:hypothetical protein BDV95DRAFT_491534 [Massariosphaeria phaeospora]
MDTQQRGRSPSAGQHAHIRHSPSPSPHAPFHSTAAGLGLDQSLSAPDPYASFSTVTTAGQPYDTTPHYLTSSQPHQFAQSAAADQPFLQARQGLSQHSPSPQFAPQGNHLVPDPLDINSSNPDFSNFFANNSIHPDQAIDPSFLSSTLDPQLLDSQPQNQSVNPSDLMNQMATTQAHSPTPPHLLQAMHQQSPSPNASPNLSQGAFPSPGHSRHASLDPNTAYTQMPTNEWGGMATYRGHRRTPSETYSDVSSARGSPYLGHNDSFETDNPSPLLNAQQDPSLFQEVMQFGQFNLNDNSHVSPGHSPHISPRLIPQQGLPQPQPSFGMDPAMNNHFGQQPMGPYPGQEPFPTINHNNGQEFGQADTMSPPEINIDFAPPSRQASFEPPKPEHQADALSPPDRSRSRNRIRAKSDPFSSTSVSSRASTPASTANRSLSPNAARVSRSPSPSTKSSRRSSTSSIPNRDYILDLADPSRPASSLPGEGGSSAKRTQKHPATFQCTLCPKRFTRAYNLRSHLRTHTDERPFVCSVCSKAFARQHDRKRHEGLHSGEKKFVCRGNLKDASNWGCGRRFARADALGRHFRSEAGRVCIRPLLEEEAQEKGGWNDQNQHMDNGNGMFGAPMAAQNYGGMMAQPGFEAFPAGGGPTQFALPAQLLAQYPALAGIQWDQLPPGPPDDVDGDISGRSSFDASSGGELFDDESDYPPQHAVYGGGWASDYESNAR